MVKYEDFLAGKQRIPPPCGFYVDKPAMNIHMFEWQKDIARWALRKGGAALWLLIAAGILWVQILAAVSEEAEKALGAMKNE